MAALVKDKGGESNLIIGRVAVYLFTLFYFLFGVDELD